MSSDGQNRVTRHISQRPRAARFAAGDRGAKLDTVNLEALCATGNVHPTDILALITVWLLNEVIGQTDIPDGCSAALAQLNASSQLCLSERGTLATRCRPLTTTSISGFAAGCIK